MAANNKKTDKKLLRNPVFWVLPALFVAGMVWFITYAGAPKQITTSEGFDLLRGETVNKIVINDGSQQVSLDLDKDFEKRTDDGPVNVGKKVVFTYVRPQAETVANLVGRADPEKGFDSIYPTSSWVSTMVSLVLPMVIILVFFYFIAMKMQGGGKLMGVGKSNAKKFSKEDPQVTFADVAGEDEAVEELQEIREFLAEPSKFHALGAKIPKGVLLYGPPGTGKTLLARAVAGEASVPFFSMSGSEFVEMFVGVGASRVRDLFEQAKSHAPAIIFVDEIDAVGRHRGTGMGGGHDEREQTLNQMLVELDGFDERTNVILIAATNRPDVLDPALLRPGRFDRQIAVEAPDMKGRHAILQVHAKGKPLTADVDLQQVAKRTPGFTGADLANVLNEAALLTARSNADLIDNRALDEAIDRVVAGPQRRTLVMSDHDKKVTAYHEGGHALAAAASLYSDPVTKVTILPRGRALGYTMVMPAEDRYSKTRNQLLDELVYAMGGRVAEEMIFKDPSTGASNDIEKATKLARAMVTKYGMSQNIGTVRLGDSGGEPFVGLAGDNRAIEYSDSLAAQIDAEVRTLVDTAFAEAWELLYQNRHVLHRLANELLEKETLVESELRDIFADVVRPAERQLWRINPDLPDVPEELLLTTAAESIEAEADATSPEAAPQDKAAETPAEDPALKPAEGPEDAD